MTREEAGKVIKDGLEDMSLDYIDIEQYEALTMAISALSQEPSGDLISREETLTAFADYVGSGMSMDDYDALWNIVTKMPSVNPQEPKTGHWILRPHIYGVAFCSECGYELKINNTNYCPNCGAKMVEPQETETWNGYHGQITAPKGTFERIFNDADDEDDI